MPSEQQLARIYSILGNTHMTTTDRVLLIFLEREYPILLQGVQIKILAGKLARDAGLSRDTSTKFLAAMRDCGAFLYEVKRSSVLVHNDGSVMREWEAESFVTETDLCISSPWKIKTRDTPKRTHHRQLMTFARRCRVCGSEDILFRVEPICRSCGHRQPLEIVNFFGLQHLRQE